MSMRDVIKQVSPSLAEILIPTNVGLTKVGTGFAVSKGRVASCMHVLNNISGHRVQFWGEAQPHEAKILIYDADHDLVIFSVDSVPRLLELGEFAQVEAGDDVLWGGFPLEIWVPSFHRGMISFKGKLRLPPLKDDIEALQLDGTMNRGNSGGPVIDPRDGRVVAIVSSSMGAIDEELAALLQRQEPGGGVRIMGVDPVAGLKKIIADMDRHLQLGIGYGISVDYMSQLLTEA